jgi:glycosyltransferase involved in cell wall biosynthesis
MKIWLYTVTHNEAKILPFFLRHYEQFCDRITVFDDASTDGTPDLVRACAKGHLEKYPYPDGLDDRQFIQLAQSRTAGYRRARGQADWVIWCDPDEFLYHPNLVPTLDQFLKAGVQVPLTRGFQMISDSFPDYSTGRQIWELIDEGIEDPAYAKPLVFRPECELQWEPGKHYVHGSFIRDVSPVLKMLHYRCLGLDYLRGRHARNYARCSKANIAAGLGMGVYPAYTGHMSEPWFKEVWPTRKPVLNHSTFYELLRVIHQGENPYLDDSRPSALTLQPTWGSEHPWLHETIDRVQPQVLIEVGTFLGRSALHMGERLKQLGLDSAIICVDTWLGDDEHWTIPEVRKMLERRNGRPEFYKTFRGNMMAAGLDKTIIPLPIDSISGARLLARWGVKADFIHIDAAKAEGEVHRDLVNYWSLLRAGGVMLIDDYGDARFEGLQRDVDKFAREKNLKLETNGVKARLWK